MPGGGNAKQHKTPPGLFNSFGHQEILGPEEVLVTLRAPAAAPPVRLRVLVVRVQRCN